MNNYGFPEEMSNVHSYELSYEEKERFTQLSLGKSIAQASEISPGKSDFDDYTVSHAIDQDFAEPPPLCPVPMLGRQYAMDERRTVIEVAETKACEFTAELFAIPAEPEKIIQTKELTMEGDVGFLLQSMIES